MIMDKEVVIHLVEENHELLHMNHDLVEENHELVEQNEELLKLCMWAKWVVGL